MTCTQCGSSIEREARFCSTCGAPVATSPEPETPPVAVSEPATGKKTRKGYLARINSRTTPWTAKPKVSPVACGCFFLVMLAVVAGLVWIISRSAG